MRKLFVCSLFFAVALLAGAQLTVTETVFDRDANEENFAFGADISWVSQQESWGTYYVNKKGKRADLMTILKEDYKLNALRFRVWVNPAGGWSGKQDVINLAKRAHAKGFKIMISFHYSDTWADSGNQTIPGQWKDHSVEALEKNVYDHTKDVLSGLKAEGIIPTWVSIGNETKYGMLYEVGRTNSAQGYQNFVRFINAGAKAVKEIDENILTIIHLSNGHDESTARNMFDNLNKYGANYDMIGLSTYPRWSHLDVTTDAQVASAVDKYLTVFKNLRSRFNKPVISMETGHYADQPYDANRFLAEFMKALIANGFPGTFYWEPEAFDNSGYNLGAWSSATHQANIAMDAYLGLKHTKVDRYATTRISLPSDTAVYQPDDTVTMKVYAKTPTTITTVQSVDFYLNKTLTYSQTEHDKLNYFQLDTASLATGAYVFHAIVNDDQGHTLSTDTLSFLVGDVKIIQENEPGFVGFPDSLATPVTKTVRKYTGTGYVATTGQRKEALAWDMVFPAPGTYTVFFRYHSPQLFTCNMLLDDKRQVVGFTRTPEGKWGYLQKEIEVESAGMKRLTVQGLTRGLPDIDFVAIASPEGVGHVETDIADGIERVGRDDESSSHAVFDLQGRRVGDGTSVSRLPKGIYMTNGKKIFVK